MTDPVGCLRRVLVVVPALNEAGSVGGVVREVRAAVSTLPLGTHLDVLVVDDGSSDETASAARSAGAMVCRLPFNLGVGGAMRAGYRFAQRNGYGVVVQVDADGQHDPRYLGVLLDGLEHADVVIGARFAGEGAYPARGMRRVAMRVLAAVLSRLSKQDLTDVTSGFRAAGPRAVAVFATHYPSEYLGDTVESLVIALRLGCTVSQVPVSMRVRSVGTASQSSTRAAVFLLRALVALCLTLVRRWPAQLSAAEGVPT
jgi:glycosyltransferase involved in cell wall biosynthesis